MSSVLHPAEWTPPSLPPLAWRRRLPGLLMGATAIALLAAAWHEAPPARLPHDASPQARAAQDAAAERLHREFRHFALNALLLPLLDPEAEPARWVEPALASGCGERAAVWVDGQRLQPGRAVPAGPFRLRWQLDDCRPFGPASLRLEGAVELAVRRDGRGWHAELHPLGLQLADAHATLAWMQPFEAHAE